MGRLGILNNLPGRRPNRHRASADFYLHLVASTHPYRDSLPAKPCPGSPTIKALNMEKMKTTILSLSTLLLAVGAAAQSPIPGGGGEYRLPSAPCVTPALRASVVAMLDANLQDLQRRGQLPPPQAPGLSESNAVLFDWPLRLAPGVIRPGDAVICFNFRPDRVRQLIRALVLDDFQSFPRQRCQPLDVVTFTQYEQGLPVAVAFPPESLDGLLGQVVSEHGLRQFRTAETEKYPHVTYFMNGGIEQAFPGEDRHLVPSPRVATYDLAPEMAAGKLTDSCIAAIQKGIYSLVVINYANPDMVGHTGLMQATTEAIHMVDRCVGRLVEATNRMGGTLLITADHGNAEMMQGPDGHPWTAHTTNPVPVILVEGEKRQLAGHGNDVCLRQGGGLADIAPTLLEILGLPKPVRMTGESLIVPAGAPAAVGGRRPQAVS